jgi:hypothetical protein
VLNSVPLPLGHGRSSPRTPVTTPGSSKSVRILWSSIWLISVGINEGIRELSSLEIDDLNVSMEPEDHIWHKGGCFQSTYSSLLQLLVLKKGSEKDTPSPSPPAATNMPSIVSSTSSHKRPASLDLAAHEPPPKHVNPPHSSTPGLQTPELLPTLPDPRFSDGSGASRESGPEDLTKTFIHNFVSDAIRRLGSEFRTFNWTRSPVGTRLMIGLFSLRNLSDQLGHKIKCISDWEQRS